LLEPEWSIDTADPTLQTDQPESLFPADLTNPDHPANRLALLRLDHAKPGGLVPIGYRGVLKPGKGFLHHSGKSGVDRGNGSSQTGTTGEAAPAEEPNYYDVLQISPQAEAETVHRVYRIMAARFHPDNPETGDTDKFLLLKKAYEVLSDPDRRNEYDARHKRQDAEPMPIFEMKDFVIGVEAESNRRLGVLSLLYNQRRMDSDHPSLSLLILEQRMSFPREYLNFTMWYLRAKGFVTAADNADYTLTADGADYVEQNIVKSDILGKLLLPS
jgi:hypothetical protein